MFVAIDTTQDDPASVSPVPFVDPVRSTLQTSRKTAPSVYRKNYRYCMSYPCHSTGKNTCTEQANQRLPIIGGIFCPLMHSTPVGQTFFADGPCEENDSQNADASLTSLGNSKAPSWYDSYLKRNHWPGGSTF